MEQDNCFGIISSNDSKQITCQSRATVLDSLTDELDVNSSNHVFENMEHKDLNALDLKKDNTMCTSPSTLLENLIDETAFDSNSQDTQSMEQENCFGAISSNDTKQTISRSPATVLDRLTEELDVDSNKHALESIEHKDLDALDFSKDNTINTSSSTFFENLTDETATDCNSQDIVNGESYAENNEEIKSLATKQKRTRDLINQSLSLPYFKMSRPNFHEFTNNVAKNLEVPMKGMQPLNFKPLKQILPLKKLQNHKKSFDEKQIVGDKEYADIVLCEGWSTSKKVPSSCSKTIKESCRLQRENLIQRLKDQMQKKKEAAFDRHKELQKADEEICDSDAEGFDEVFDNDSRSPTPSSTIEDSLASKETPFSDNEDSCILPLKKALFKSDVESTSNEATHDLRSSDEENFSEKFDDFMDSPPVPLSIPSYQPNGGFAVENDVSSDSCNSDSEKVHLSETYGSSQSFTITNSFDLNTSQVASFALDEVSSICSGKFLSMDEERPWTPSSDSQVNRKEDLDIRFNDGKSLDSEEELETDKSQFIECSHINSPPVSKRKSFDNYAEERFSPPLKKYKKDLSHCESSRNHSSLKIDEIMQDVYENYSTNVDNLSQNSPMNYHSSKELTDCIAELQSHETSDNEDAEEIQCVPRIRKCRPLIDYSDEEEEETNLSNNHQQFIEALPQNQIGDDPNLLRINDFLDEEAELSGDEASSDESDVEDGDDEAEQELLLEDLPAEEELKEQVANIHFKHELDDDARIIKRLQQDFLPEGELHLDGSGRQKSFHWSNNVSYNMQNEIVSESEPEDNIESPMVQDKIKWRQETSVIQKCSDSDSNDGKEKTPSFKKLPVSIIGRSLSSQTTYGIPKHVASSSFTRRHGSLIQVAESEGLNLNVSSSGQRKTVLFQALSHSDKMNSSTSQALDGKSVFEKLLH